MMRVSSKVGIVNDAEMENTVVVRLESAEPLTCAVVYEYALAFWVWPVCS